MKIGKIVRIIAVISSVYVIFLGLWWEYNHMNHGEKVTEEVCFTEEFGNVPIEFKIWEATQDEIYYLILPAAFKEQTAKFKIEYSDFFYQIYIDDVFYYNQSIWEEALQEQFHTIQIKDLFGKVHVDKQIRVLKSGELPVMMVTVEAKDELYNNLDFDNKSYVEKGELLFFNADGELMVNTSLDCFKVRGNSTAKLEKKPFALTFPQPVSLCGIEETLDFNLLANMTDGSNIRNKMMLDWANEMTDSYVPEGEFVELFLNGEYQGVYLLTETVKADEESLLVEMELDYNVKPGQFHVQTKRGHTFLIHSEEYVSDNALQEVEVYLNEIEDALYIQEETAEDAQKLSELIDMESWTDTWFLREVSADHDMGTISQFAYVSDWEEKGILYAGPAWDFDATFGNGMVPLFRNPRSLVAAMIDTKGIESTNQNRWLAPMYENPEFKSLLISKFQKEYVDKIERLVNEEIDAYMNAIERSALIDSLKWNSDGMHDYIYAPEGFEIPKEGDYDKYDFRDIHASMLKDFLLQKKQFLQELWIEEANFEVLVEEHNEEGMNLELNNNIYTWVRKE